MSIRTRRRHRRHRIWTSRAYGPSTRNDEIAIVASLALVIGATTVAELVAVLVLPSLRSLLAVYLVFSFSLLGVLAVHARRLRRPRGSTNPEDPCPQTVPADPD